MKYWQEVDPAIAYADIWNTNNTTSIIIQSLLRGLSLLLSMTQDLLMHVTYWRRNITA